MTEFFYEQDADLAALAGQQVAVVGYGNQGRPWALNLRDSGLSVSVHVRADETREQAIADGFDAGDIADASSADVICVLIPDDAIPGLGLAPGPEALTIVASGYTLAFDRFTPDGDIALVAPRMLGPEVRRCYEEGVGFITAVGVHRDITGTAQARMLAVAKAIGGLRQGAIAMTPHQEAVLDLAVEQLLSPVLTHVNVTSSWCCWSWASHWRPSPPSCSIPGRWSATTGCCGRSASWPSSTTTLRPASTASSPEGAGSTMWTWPPPCGNLLKTSPQAGCRRVGRRGGRRSAQIGRVARPARRGIDQGCRGRSASQAGSQRRPAAGG